MHVVAVMRTAVVLQSVEVGEAVIRNGDDISVMALLEYLESKYKKLT